MSVPQYNLIDLPTVLEMTGLTVSQLVNLLRKEAFPDSFSNTEDQFYWLEVEVKSWLATKLQASDPYPYIDVTESTAEELVIQTRHRAIKIKLQDLMHLVSTTEMPDGSRFLKRVIFGALKRRNSLNLPA